MVLPLLFGVAGHQVEDHPNTLYRATENADVAETLAGIVLFERELEPFSQGAGGDPVGVGLDAESRERAQRRTIVLGALVDAVGRVVGHLVVVAGDALAGCAERIERGEPLDVLVGELVDV